MVHWDSIWINAKLATMADDGSDYSVIEPGAIAVKEDRIAWLGEMKELEEKNGLDTDKTYDVKGRWITPGLIDCHTHLVYGGNRANEFELRLKGASYEELQKAGGGILSTVKATRDASEQVLFESSRKRLASLRSEGITTVEIKSGYGLDVDNEIKMLKVIRRLDHEIPDVDIISTFLGAHALPSEYQNEREAYINLITEEMLPAVAETKLADAVDGFCENIGFSTAEIRRVFERSKELGLNVKLHADQLSDTSGAELAASFNALSADHLEYTNRLGIESMSRRGTTAVLLPGAFYTLGETRLPPIKVLREHQVPMAVATDANPGSSPIVSLLTVLNMACVLFKLTPAEALAGVTKYAARALGIGDDRGTLEVNKRADFVIWDVETPAELAYMVGSRPIVGVVKNGICRNADTI